MFSFKTDIFLFYVCVGGCVCVCARVCAMVFLIIFSCSVLFLGLFCLFCFFPLIDVFASLPGSVFAPCLTYWPWFRVTPCPACLSLFMSSTRHSLRAESSVFCLVFCSLRALARVRVEKESCPKALSGPSLGYPVSRESERKPVLLPLRHMQFREGGPINK